MSPWGNWWTVANKSELWNIGEGKGKKDRIQIKSPAEHLHLLFQGSLVFVI